MTALSLIASLLAGGAIGLVVVYLVSAIAAAIQRAVHPCSCCVSLTRDLQGGGFDPGDQVAATITDASGCLDEFRPPAAIPPRLQCADGMTKQDGCLALGEKDVRVVGNVINDVACLYHRLRFLLVRCDGSPFIPIGTARQTGSIPENPVSLRLKRDPNEDQ